jgi:hypothetical protein
MPAAGVVLIVAVVLIVLALVYYLLSTIGSLMRITTGLDDAIAAVTEIAEKTAPVEAVVKDINNNLDAGVDLLEGLLVKKAGLVDAMGLVEGLYPGAAAAGLRNFPDSAQVSRRAFSEVYTKGTLTLARLGREAPIAAASPNGPVLRNIEGGSLDARLLYPEGRQSRPERLPRSPVIGTGAPSSTRRASSAAARRRTRERPGEGALGGDGAEGVVPAELGDRTRPGRCSPRTQESAAKRLGETTGSDAPATETGSTRPRRRGRRPQLDRRELVQTPASFEYERATSVEGALEALQRLGSEARVIAGGHSLLPMMKLRLANPEHLVDINDLHELSYIREEGSEVRIGALTRHVELLDSDLLATRFPVFRDAERVIADPVGAQPRNDRRLALPGGRRGGPVRGVLGVEGAGRDPRPRGRAGVGPRRLLHRPVHHGRG